MTYPEDVLKAAREAAAKSAETQHLVALPDMYRDGTYDRSHEVRTACIAIMAERQRCAEKLEPLQTLGLIDDEGIATYAQVVDLDDAKVAILGQREALARKFRAPSDEVMKGVTWRHGPCRVLKADAVGQQETGDDKA